MIPQDKEQLSEWIEERQKTFQGSLRHVLYLLTHDVCTQIFRLFVIGGIAGWFYLDTKSKRVAEI